MFGADARRELRDFLAYARGIWDVVAPAFVFGPAPTPQSVLRQGPRAWWSVLHIDAFRTMDQAVRARVREPHLRDVLLRYATYNGSDPRRAPATLHCIAHVELGLGGWGVEGGMGALVEALVGLARRKGVEIVTGVRVAEIEIERGRAHGVRLAEGRRVSAHTVIANMEPRALGRMLGGPSTDSSRGEGAPSMSGWTAVARARRRSPRAPHTVLFPAHYEQEFVDIFDHRALPADPTIYCCAQEPAHGVRGWADHEPVFVMVNAPAADRARVDDSVAELVRGQLVERGYLEGTDRFVWVRTPADLARRFPDSNGSLYGTASHGWTAAFRRAPNRVDGVVGLYLASGSAHPGGGVPLAIQSGREAARLALQETLLGATESR